MDTIRITQAYATYGRVMKDTARRYRILRINDRQRDAIVILRRCRAFHYQLTDGNDVHLRVELIKMFVSLRIKDLRGRLRGALRVLVRSNFVWHSILRALRSNFMLLKRAKLRRIITHRRLYRDVFAARPINRRRALRTPFIARRHYLRLLIFQDVSAIRMIM